MVNPKYITGLGYRCAAHSSIMLPMHSSGPCMQSTPSLAVGLDRVSKRRKQSYHKECSTYMPINDNVKFTLAFTRCMAGRIICLKQS
jgi:hypothetical protein